MREIEAAKRVANFLNASSHLVIDFDLRAIGGSALTDQIDVPKSRSATQISHGIPVTYVPARNTIFLSFGLALAERIGADDIFFGANQLDYSGYPDCREEYIRAFKNGQSRHQGGRRRQKPIKNPRAADADEQSRHHRERHRTRRRL